MLARSEEPEVQRLPRQVYLWSSSFLQSCYYFDALLRTPFKAGKAWRKRRRDKASGVEDLRMIKEQYRQPFGEAATREYGRPIGWTMFLGAVEKIGFPHRADLHADPAHVGSAGGHGDRRAGGVADGAGDREQGPALAMLAKGIAVTPLRYVLMVSDLITTARFAIDLWITGNRKWRK